MTNTYKPSKIIAVFLVQFDTRKGYELLWSKSSINNFDFTGLDYKVLPSGIHETEKSVVLISHLHQDKLYYGSSRFIQRIDGDSSNRDNIHMYSLGILCDPTIQSWKPNEFINCGWEYITVLDDKLTQYMNKKDYSNYQIFASLIQTNSLSPHEFVPNLSNHLITKLPKLLEIFGPLIFPIYKQCLLRKNIIMFNNKSDNNTFPDSYFTIESFSYLISLISIIPQDIKNIDANYFSQPLYNIGLNDAAAIFEYSSGYIATTNDDILMYQRDKYDWGILLNNQDNNPEIKSDLSDKLQPSLKANLKDYNKLKYLIKNFEHQDRLPISDDLRSIHSCMSNLDGGNTINTNADFLTKDEPDWWIHDATYPMTWREFIWSAFSWFASAGTEIQTAKDVDDFYIESPRKIDFIQLINIIGYFHNLTRKWFELINSIISEEIEEVGHQTDSLLNKFTVELSYQDIIDMELDPYDEKDLQFVREFILLYWGKSVENVEIGLGIASICC